MIENEENKYTNLEQYVKEYNNTHVQQDKELIFNRILDGVKPLLIYIIRQYSIRGYEEEDLLQEAYLCLIKALERYEEDAKAKFTSYLHILVVNRMRNLIRNTNTLKKAQEHSNVSLDVPITFEEDMTLMNIVADKKAFTPMEYVLAKHTENHFKNSRKKLTKIEYDVLCLKEKGYPLSSIATQMEITYKQADNALHRARKKLFKEYQRYISEE